MPATPSAWSASLTSSSLCGLMTASIFFMSRTLRPWVRLQFVPGLRVLGYVETRGLDILADPDAHRSVQKFQDDERDDEGEGDRRSHSDELLAQEHEAATGEQSVGAGRVHSQRREDARQ